MNTTWKLPTGDRNEGKIYGFVGVTGSGKDYQVGLLKDLDEASKRPCLTGDFSEGIRQTVMTFLMPWGEVQVIDPESQEYRDWKNLEFEVPLPVSCSGMDMLRSKITGRNILQNVGEGMKRVCGKDVWANWTANHILQRWLALPEIDKMKADVVFGSIRFDYEAEQVFKVAGIMHKTVEIYMCDYHSQFYKVLDHESENFAKYFLGLGYKDGQNITDAVYQKIMGL